VETGWEEGEIFHPQMIKALLGGFLTGLEEVEMKKVKKLHFVLPLKTPIVVPYSN